MNIVNAPCIKNANWTFTLVSLYTKRKIEIYEIILKIEIILFKNFDYIKARFGEKSKITLTL